MRTCINRNKMALLVILLGFATYVAAEFDITQFTLSESVIEDSKLTVPQIIAKYGYPIEIHTVETDDGYILEMHRIPHGISKSTNQTNRPAVLLSNDIMGCSSNWVLTRPGRALAYKLADAGYDVWMGNDRGNRYSRKHKTLDPIADGAKFWDFSWHEIGVYDLPKMIDHVLETIAQSDLTHIGFAQGTTTFYVMASERPEYNEKIKAHFSLAPLSFLDNARNTTRILSLLPNSISLSALGTFGTIPSGEINPIGCGTGVQQLVCLNISVILDRYNPDQLDTELLPLTSSASTQQMLHYVQSMQSGGYNPDQLDTDLLPLLMAHTSSAALKQPLHYSQEMQSGKFRQYDHGLIGNLLKYNKLSPPCYPIDKITAKIYLFWSANDGFSNPIDVERLHRNLPNVAESYPLSDQTFSHFDYIWGLDADAVVNEPILQRLASL